MSIPGRPETRSSAHVESTTGDQLSTNERGWMLALRGRAALTGRVNGAISPRDKGVSRVIHRGVEWFLGLFRWLARPFLILVMLEQPPVLFKLI